MKRERLLQRINSYFIVHTLTKVFSFCLVILYAFYISPEALGKYEYIQTLINIIVPFFFLSIWESILKFGLKEDEIKKEKVIGTSAIFTLISTLVLTLVCIAWFFLRDVKNIWYISFVILTYVLDALVIMWQHYIKVLNKYDIYVKSASAGSIISIVFALILVIGFRLEFEALFVSSILGMLVTFITIELKEHLIKYITKENFDSTLLKNMLKYSVPLVASAALTWIITGLSKTVITNNLGAAENGLYSFAHKFTIVITFVSTIINTAITEEMLTLSKDEFNKEFSKITEKLCQSFLIIATIFMPIIMGIYKIIEHTKYYSSKKYVALLIIYFVFFTISGHIATIFKVYSKNKDHMLATLIGAVVTVIAVICMLNVLGTMGVVISQVIGVIVMLVSVYVFSRKYVKINVNYMKIVILLLIYTLISITTYFGNIYLIVLTMLFTIFIFKDNILNIIKEYKGNKSEKTNI